ncbi:hypothetical protein DASC09_047030 [Saccharomycopsis crataegensis]|uniref:NAD(P)-binding domain-containing protein n=1 Tax=Saccharomycopsis crataegensis TaxID=43959 RepID=A0AAV5QTA0_9ASCO|nr:hypothetical protein DASC09_047030 [Saccharomycopsis crataegensis]
MSKNIFILGASGFIGGEILYQLLQEFPEFSISCLLRSEEKAKKLQTATGNRISVVLGDLKSANVLEQKFQEADIVITAADVDDEESIEVLAKVAKVKTKPFYIIHTSGTCVLNDGLGPDTVKKFSGVPYNDLTDNEKLNQLPDEQPHRRVEKLVLSIEKSNPKYVKTAIICASTVYGFNHGWFHRISCQVPWLIKYSLANDQAFSVYNGNYIWSHVHVRDLGKLFILVLIKMLEDDKELPTGTKGYFFAENGYHYWKDVSKAVERTLLDRNKISQEGVAELEPSQVEKLCSVHFAPYMWGTNCFSKADLSRKIGWKADFSDVTFWEDIIQQADYHLDGTIASY